MLPLATPDNTAGRGCSALDGETASQFALSRGPARRVRYCAPAAALRGYPQHQNVFRHSSMWRRGSAGADARTIAVISTSPAPACRGLADRMYRDRSRHRMQIRSSSVLVGLAKYTQAYRETAPSGIG